MEGLAMSESLILTPHESPMKLPIDILRGTSIQGLIVSD